MRLLYAQIIVVIITCCTPLKGRISEETLEVDADSSSETDREVEFSKKNLEIAMNSLNALDLISGSMDRQTSSVVNFEDVTKAKVGVDKSLNEAIQKRANVIALLAQIFGELGATNLVIDPSGNSVAYIESLSFRENLKPNQRLFLKIESQKLREFEEPNLQSVGFVLRNEVNEIHFQFMIYKANVDGLNEKFIALNFDEVNRLFQNFYGAEDLIRHDIISGSIGIRDSGDNYLIKTSNFSWLSKNAFYVVEDLEIKTSLDFKSLHSIKMTAQAEVFVTSELIGFIDLDIDNDEGGIPKLDVDFRVEK